MLPVFLIEEATVRESGESSPVAIGEGSGEALLITLGITHAIEQQSLDIDILVSEDGFAWSPLPAGSFLRKSWCGTYQIVVSSVKAKFLKAVWRLNRWGRGDHGPYCRFYIFAESAKVRAMAGAA
jgi:hypothetical protein